MPVHRTTVVRASLRKPSFHTATLAPTAMRKHAIQPREDKTPWCCQWINLREALYHFVSNTQAIRSQGHIKPLHWYVACRLVLEGGFHPDEITPRPPFSVKRVGDRQLLQFDPARANDQEETILGGIKTKNVDVAVTKPGLGPVLAISCRGMTGALRNLPNRMEDMVGESTNLHMTYPALVFGFLFAVRANTASTSFFNEDLDNKGLNDIAMQADGTPVDSLLRFQAGLQEITGRHGLRDAIGRYEASALVLVEPEGEMAGMVDPRFPRADSGIRLDQFFTNLYREYDERFVTGAPSLATRTRRHYWDGQSPLLQGGSDTSFPVLDFNVRLA